jgi:hypothetical protein
LHIGGGSSPCPFEIDVDFDGGDCKISFPLAQEGAPQFIYSQDEIMVSIETYTNFYFLLEGNIGFKEKKLTHQIT